MSPLASRIFSSLVTSHTLRDARRGSASLARRLTGRAAEVHYFHQVDDPYSHLTAQTLGRLVGSYRIRLVPHLVPRPSDAAAGDRDRLQRWSRIDAATLAGAMGLEAPTASQQPESDAIGMANDALVAAIARDCFGERAVDVGRALGSVDRDRLVSLAGGAEANATAAALKEGEQLRQKWGHYLAATFYYGGEWYWGVDRLRFLEERLRSEGLGGQHDTGFISDVPALTFAATLPPRRRPVLHFFCSFRSPYTYLAVPRVRRLAQHYGAELRLRFVLPMAMRGLPVPFAKRLYILRDAKREADRLGMRFGHVADPLGTPTKRGLAVLHHAIRVGRGPEFAESFLQGVFADGIDSRSVKGMRRIAQRAGLDEALVVQAIGDGSWRDVAEANRVELLSLGLWGVPSFRVDDRQPYWGQDRLWAVERDLIAVSRKSLD